MSELGQRQATRLAELVTAGRIDALFSSPALRCQQTLQSVADRLGLPIQVLAELRETHGFTPPLGWDAQFWSDIHAPLGGAFAAGRAAAALRRITSRCPAGHAVVCSHGDIIPVLLAYLTGEHDLTPIAPLTRRGGWYTIETRNDDIKLTTHPAPGDFPR